MNERHSSHNRRDEPSRRKSDGHRNGESHVNGELDALLHALCDDRLDDAGRARLKAVLAESDDACRRYIEFMHLCVGLSYPYAARRGAGSDGLGASSDQADHDAESTESVSSRAAAIGPILPLGGDSLSGSDSPLAGGSGLDASGSNSASSGSRADAGNWSSLFDLRLWAVGSAIGALALAAILWTSGGEPERVVKEGAQPVLESTSLAYVARIVATSEDCEWGDRNAPREFLLRVRANDPVHLTAGLAELEFYSGARIIVHGPALFTPTSPSAGHLESGRVTGNVSEGDFRLTTPTARVIDLGTAFGVSADAAVGTDVVVFDGRVQVQSLANVGGDSGILDMTEGMAARIRLDGSAEYGLKSEAGQFARKIPASVAPDRVGEVSLIDIIAGGNGLEGRLAGAIDLGNGKRDYRQQGSVELHRGHVSDGMYHPSDCSPLIDGVFIPVAQGKQVQIDSSGRRVDVPPSCGAAHATLWARSKESIQAMKAGPDYDFWGARTLPRIVEKLRTVRTGLVGMHSNMGVTFDLKKLQMVHRRMPAEFRGAVANIENSADWGPNERPNVIVKNRYADCRIFVDGELRFVREKIWRDDGEIEFTVPLSAEDRFLTIVTTDGDGDLRYDHVVLIDPVIVLHEQ